MANKELQWLKQAEYDYETANFMYTGKRYFYAVFMCHLAVEKALKGLYQRKLAKVPPKTHNLIYLLDEIGVIPDENIGREMAKLNEAHITTRYPEDIDKLQEVYTQAVTERILARTKEILEWIRKQF